MTRPPPVTARILLAKGDQLGLRLHAANGGLDRALTSAEVNQPARVVSGDAVEHPGAVVIFGQADVEWLLVRPPAEQVSALRERLGPELPAVVVCHGIFPPASLQELAAGVGVPIFSTRRTVGEVTRELRCVLAAALAVREVVHGELLQIHNLGVLIIGESGIGKTESALELILRGHRLVADDVIDLERGGPALLGRGREGLQHFLEARGLGVLHAGDLFGQAAVLEKTAVHLVVELVHWTVEGVDRTGLDDHTWSALGVEIPLVRLPVRPGRNLALLIEVAARNQTLKRRGIHSARRLAAELERQLSSGEDDGSGHPR